MNIEPITTKRIYQEIIGLVDIRAGGGAYLTDFNLGSFLDLLSPLFLKRKNFGLELLEVRQILEVRAAKLAAEQSDSTAIRELSIVLRGMEKTDSKDYEEGVKWVVAFHKALFKCTNNIVLIKGSELVNSLMEISITDARKLVLEHAETPDQLYAEHKTILEAIREQAPERASEAMKRHLKMVKKNV